MGCTETPASPVPPPVPGNPEPEKGKDRPRRTDHRIGSARDQRIGRPAAQRAEQEERQDHLRTVGHFDEPPECQENRRVHRHVEKAAMQEGMAHEHHHGLPRVDGTVGAIEQPGPEGAQREGTDPEVRIKEDAPVGERKHDLDHRDDPGKTDQNLGQGSVGAVDRNWISQCLLACWRRADPEAVPRSGPPAALFRDVAPHTARGNCSSPFRPPTDPMRRDLDLAPVDRPGYPAQNGVNGEEQTGVQGRPGQIFRFVRQRGGNT